jgi:hypothetical protein
MGHEGGGQLFDVVGQGAETESLGPQAGAFNGVEMPSMDSFFTTRPNSPMIFSRSATMPVTTASSDRLSRLVPISQTPVMCSNSPESLPNTSFMA